MITDNPIMDAQDYFNSERIPEPEHRCNYCEEMFWRGKRFEEEKFCDRCIEQEKHLEFYRQLELSDRQIYEILNKEIIIN